MRPSFSNIYMNLAESLSKRSTCCRLQVGTVITSTDYRKVLALGYNGNAIGLHNTCDREEQGNCGCFPPNVKIRTKKGLKSIQDIKVGDLVLTHKGRYKPVTEVMHRPRAVRKFIKFRFAASSYRLNAALKGAKSLRFVSTDNHPLLVEKNGKVSWIEAKDIEIGDFVFVSGKKCRKCNIIIPYFRHYCNNCFKKSSKSKKMRKKHSNRLKVNNPMHKLYNSAVKATPKNEAGVTHKKSQIKSFIELKSKIINFVNKFKNKYKVIITDHIGVRPDAILIDYDARKVTAFEYEKTEKGYMDKRNKYPDNVNDYDDVIWHIENPTPSEFGDLNGFAKVKVSYKKEKTVNQSIYNLEVETDHSFVCQNTVVHNCLHSEDNAIINCDVPRNVEKLVFVTHLPCVQCAKRFINLGNVQKVTYKYEYRDNSSEIILLNAGIRVERIYES